MEALRRCPLAIAQRLVHCAIAVSTAVLDRVTKTMSVALLLMNKLDNSKQKGSKTAQLHLPIHDLFWANLRVQLHLPPLRSLDLLISPGTLTLAFESGYNYSLLLLCATDSAGYRNETKITHYPLVTDTKQRSRTLRWLPTPNKDHALSAGYRHQRWLPTPNNDHALSAGYRHQTKITHSPLVTDTKQRSRTLRWLPTPNKDHALSAGYRHQTKITHSPLVTDTKQRSHTLRWLPTPNKDHALSAGYRHQRSRTLRWLPKPNKDHALSAGFCVSTLHTNSKHWFTTSFLQEGAEKRCSEWTLHTATLMLRPWLYSSWTKPWMITQIITTH